MSIVSDIQKGAKRAIKVEWIVFAFVAFVIIMAYLKSSLPGAAQVRRVAGVSSSSSG